MSPNAPDISRRARRRPRPARGARRRDRAHAGRDLRDPGADGRRGRTRRVDRAALSGARPRGRAHRRAGNVIARRPGAARGSPVVLCAHLDTVFPRDLPLRVRRDGPRLVGPGIGDNGRGLAVMLALADAIDGRAAHAPAGGVRRDGRRGRARRPARREALLRRRAGALRRRRRRRRRRRAGGAPRARLAALRVSFAGPGGHSWAAFGVPNAVHAAAACAACLAALRRRPSRARRSP